MGCDTPLEPLGGVCCENGKGSEPVALSILPVIVQASHRHDALISVVDVVRLLYLVLLHTIASRERPYLKAAAFGRAQNLVCIVNTTPHYL